MKKEPNHSHRQRPRKYATFWQRSKNLMELFRKMQVAEVYPFLCHYSVGDPEEEVVTMYKSLQASDLSHI
jgi:hypothetical protein